MEQRPAKLRKGISGTATGIFGVDILPSPPPPISPGDELLDDVLLPPPPPPVFLGVESPPVFQGVECVLADSVVQDKDTSLPTIISLAEHSPNTTKDAPNGSNEFGLELRGTDSY